MVANFTPPDVRLGDSVYWYHDPLALHEPRLGWVCERPGAQTVSILVFAPGTGFVEKTSVRHKDDPGLQENPAWRGWGCWDFSSSHKDVLRAQQVASSVALNHDRDARKQGSNAVK
jgi:hypothetical protein